MDIQETKPTAIEYQQSRSLPQWPEILGENKYREVTNDQIANKNALRDIVHEYEGYYQNLDKLGSLLDRIKEKNLLNPLVLSGLKSVPEEEEDEALDNEETQNSHWLDRDYLLKLTEAAREILDKNILTSQNLGLARALTAAMYSEALEVIADQQTLIKELESETGEIDPETKEENQLMIKHARSLIEEQKEFLVKSLQAGHYLTQTFVSASRN